MWRPYWEREANVTTRHIPYSATDDIQAAGLGNPKLTVRAYLTDDADIDTLIAAIGTTGRNLTDLFEAGTTLSNTRLIEVSNIRRHDYEERITCTLVFMREGS